MLQGGRNDALTATVCGFYYPNRRTGRLEGRMPRPANSLSDWVSGCWFSPGSALLIPRAAFDLVGLMDETLRRLEDLDWFIRFGQKGGRLQVAPCMGTLIAPSYSGRSETIMAAADLIEQRFSQSGPHALGRAEGHRLQAYLALERGAAMLHEGKRLRGLGFILASLWHKPRLQATVETFWDRSGDAPDDVAKMFADMLHQPR